ncbi:oxidoreductase, Gfo/Idh/MocA family [Acidisarcina polymorpha]|uniref:Oxidoreductase, Gfo/Idh/MocA family n=1 Tax=Acidisarcina polymorpha TaxID=2211140 RepID=A0A2Z5G3J8_9BACT|nr:Gfo/Idh/MocA family oxidoreductase [Acidisarcina polymorpha]AXC13600.1 oxidoreductase, Gfo/Idh/MocA family [Acidisarcina polymorpha]
MPAKRFPLTAGQQEASLRVAVFGAGAFGRNHLRVYRELEQAGHAVTLVAVVDSNPDQAAQAGGEWQIPAFASIEELSAAALSIDAASVCVPTTAHFPVASALLENGIDLLIEKPIASSTEEADRLIELAQNKNCVLQVGHLERFNPAVAAIQPYLNGPMFFEAHRLSVFTPRALDVDVVLDLMIHDLDIVLKLANSPVREVRAVGLPILSRKVDIANVRLEFESGCVANFTASRVSTELVRKLRFFQPHQYVSLDYARKDLLLIDVNPTAGSPAGLGFTKPQIYPGEPLRLELEAFIHAVRTRQAPQVTGADGRAALALALEINSTIAAHAENAGLNRFQEEKRHAVTD